jgi:hypothetical protein
LVKATRNVVVTIGRRQRRRHQLGVGQRSSVLDVGSGNGMFTWWWAQRAG